ncbi:MarR family winged helix-turn-helix transcriptional regulator [Steroidobacter cummioxidans]|uniref:MarR family winged helix-turn-helix transcriptional regulator n=1 Tax=Steroidobacter cummioxidans TaxID=1803913 RepID=UPI001582A9A6|nr:MarR family transcriptional regulator [Steroidobacter cummioxidans]
MSNKRPIGRSRQTADLSMAVLKSFRIIYGSVREHFREVQRTCGISGSQLWLLHELARDGSLGVSELADKLSIHQSTCSLHVEKLVRAGLVKKTRGVEDQRRVELSVTTLGRRTIARAPGPAEGVLPEAIAELSPATLRGLSRGLQQIVSALDIKDEAAADRPLADL